ncbi:MAG: peptide deformylase, partial [candidate division WOR-3 bacterium]|nr:peptide deformylase [candidate division WOR-3 bacterium]
ARAFCHEIDHLNGILFIDRLSPTRQNMLKKQLDEIIKKCQ